MAEQPLRELTPPDFARLFGTGELPASCRKLLPQGDFQYRRLSLQEESELLDHVNNVKHPVAGSREPWERGWSEVLDSLRTTGDLDQLVPHYLKRLGPLRLWQRFIRPLDPAFQLNWYRVFTSWLFQTYFKEPSVIYEFGCGSGLNLVALARLYPGKKYVGLDWARPSQEILEEAGCIGGWDIQGRYFDFFNPDGLQLEPHSAILTVGALEQTGTNYEAFLQYILRQPIALCVHIEPILEWYNPTNPVDASAIRYHRARGYWEGFPGKLKELEAEGKVKIHKMKRAFFGSLYIEGYTQLIWRPL